MKKIISFNEGNMYNTKKWFEEYPKAEAPCKHGKTEIEVLDLKAEAKKCIDLESAAYHLKQSKSRNSEYLWLKTALSKGTISDKVAAGIVLIQNSPKHNLNHLITLVSQVKVSKHNQCSTVISAIRDLFLTDLLHPEFKLLKFEEQNLDKLDHFNKSFTGEEKHDLINKPTLSKNKLLTIWYFEDQLKEIYERFVSLLSTIANDTVDANREKAVSVINDLLMGNSEQEHKLLDFLVNKIGDPSSKVASKAIYSLSKLLYEHPNMKLIVLHEVEKLLFRTNIATRAQYFSICLLTQFVLSKEDNEVATTLIDVYFAFFKACLKKGEPDSRMMAAILAGVNRAYPFTDVNATKLNDHIDSVYKVVHVGSFNVALNALSLLFQVIGKDPNQSSRFYSAFYRKLFDSQIGTANKRAVFLNLLFRVLRSDDSIVRLHAFIKRVLQISTYFPANMTCAILYVVSQILQSKKLTNKILTKSTIHKTEEITSDESKSVEVDIKKKENSIFLSNVVSQNAYTETRCNPKHELVDIKNEIIATVYDPFCRNPLHSGANLSIYYELKALEKHYHPSVSLFAHTIIEGKAIEYSGDPLEDLSLIRFLDRYVFKNPKKLESKKVTKKNDLLLQRAAYTPKGVKSIPVDSLAYVNQKEDKIPVDELFLYQYLHKRKEFLGVQKEDEDDNESVNSEDFNNMLDELSKNRDIAELDIAGDFNAVHNKSKNNQLKSKSTVEDDSDDDSFDESEDSNLAVNESEENNSIEEFEDLDDLDDDLSDMEFSDENDDEFLTTSKKRKNEIVDRNTKKKSKGLDENTFVSAEKFAEILESQAQLKFKHRMSATFNDRDGASVKQLDWETERNQRISGFINTKAKKRFSHSKKNGNSKYLKKRIRKK